MESETDLVASRDCNWSNNNPNFVNFSNQFYSQMVKVKKLSKKKQVKEGKCRE
jgi:hypothetical protein